MMTAATSGTLKLGDLKPIAQGRMRLVFRHPHDSSLLIKVIRPEVIDQRWGTGQPWYKKRRRYRQYISYIRECEEYIAGCARHGAAIPFAQKIIGFVETDFGLGMIMEAALDQNGNLAPTLRQVARDHSLDGDIRTELEHFVRQIMASDIIIADLNPGNLVRAYTREEGHHFVLIDGLGLSTIMPFKLLSPVLNRFSKRGRVMALWKRIERIRSREQSLPVG
jgi:hypothetical protein